MLVAIIKSCTVISCSGWTRSGQCPPRRPGARALDGRGQDNVLRVDRGLMLWTEAVRAMSSVSARGSCAGWTRSGQCPPRQPGARALDKPGQGNVLGVGRGFVLWMDAVRAMSSA